MPKMKTTSQTQRAQFFRRLAIDQMNNTPPQKQTLCRDAPHGPDQPIDPIAELIEQRQFQVRGTSVAQTGRRSMDGW
jgi:hypothetical protein